LNGTIKYEFSGRTWQHASPGGWFFISLPKKTSAEIRSMLKSREEGWGRMKAVAKIGNTEWETAIWFDTKEETYLLPLMAAIRKKENIKAATRIQVVLWL
jgi:hypothetical protein